jgi:DNA-binding IclR family transcriptional regulator
MRTPSDAPVSRPSPQTDRIVTVINLLAAHPDEGFTLSEIARRLGVGKATCSPMLVALTSAGFLVRHPTRKTYRLGPALITAGQAAAAGFPALEVARPALLDLSNELGVIAMAVARAGDQLQLVDLVWDHRRHAPTLRVGQELPFRAPWGSVFVASAPRAEVDGWLERAGITGTDADAYRDALEHTAARGYAVELQESSGGDVRAIAQALATAVSERDREELVDRLLAEVTDREQPLLAAVAGDRTYTVGAIDAPVVDGDGAPILALSASAFGAPLAREQIEHVGGVVRAAATAVSGSLRGG